MHAAGHRCYEAGILPRLGSCLVASGDAPAATAAWREALCVYVELDHPEADILRAELAALD